MNIPMIGGARGIFEIFVPGMFLFLNVIAAMYLLPFTDDETRKLITEALKQPTLVIIVAIGFGYLIGVLLRLLRTELPDQWSVAWLQRFDRQARQENGEFGLWASSQESFPYIRWVGQVCQSYLPPEAQEFYTKVWATRNLQGQNKQFFNYCKILINSNDERAANEIYVAESLTRYIAGMFYALIFSFALLALAVLVQGLLLRQVTVGVVFILIAYGIAIIKIVENFRTIRIKEVETVFVASFYNKELFQPYSDKNSSDKVMALAEAEELEKK